MSRTATRVRPPSTDFEEPVLVSVAEAARQVHRTEVVIRKWISRGILTPAATRRPYGHLVRLDDVIRLAYATRHRKGLQS